MHIDWLVHITRAKLLSPLLFTLIFSDALFFSLIQPEGEKLATVHEEVVSTHSDQ